MKELYKNIESFDSVSEFIGALRTRATHDGWGEHESSQKEDKSGWYLTDSFDEACNMAVTGFPRGYEMMRKAMKDLTLDTVGVGDKPRVRNYHVGGSPNVSRAVMGLPRDMRQMHATRGKSKCVDLYCVMEAVCTVDGDEMVRVGAKELAIVSMLERNGYSVRLSVCSGARFGGVLGVNEFGWCVTLKNYRDVIDYQKLSFALTNPSWFRRLGFRYMETCPRYTEPGCKHNYGLRLRDLWDDLRKWFDKERDNAYLIGFEEMRNKNPEGWLRQHGFVKVGDVR